MKLVSIYLMLSHIDFVKIKEFQLRSASLLDVKAASLTLFG
jgi:hypothetical protein